MAVAMEAPVTSANDKKLYRRLRLPNDLDVLLISDPEMQASTDGSNAHPRDEQQSSEEDVDGEEDPDEDDDDDDNDEDDEEPETHVKKAAAAMAVGVGSFSDPDDVQGMSHYLEHMLFMGSEGFPDENDYDAYLQRHGGSANAFTEMEYTNYHFDCKPDGLRGALERFSQFFIAPLCKADALEREVNAVDNEFSGVQQDDSSRLAQLRCHTARQGHIYRKFTWGNRKSLVELPAEKGVDVRERLVQYYRQQYSAERMCLAVLGGEPLDTLQAWVADLFACVPSGRGPRPSFAHVGPPYEGGRLHVLPAVKQGHALTITFQLPSLLREYAAKAEDYVSHLVGHEGSGSLLSALKAKGWASAISAGVNEGGYERNTALFVFEVTITLTEAGLREAPGHGLAAVGPLFEYLRLLRSAGPQRWVFDELAAISALKFRFAEDEDACELVSRLAADMPLYAPAHALCGPYLHDEWRPDLVSDLLGRMTPAAARLDLQTSAFGELVERGELQRCQPGVVCDTEPWFDLPYACIPIPAEQLRAWEEPDEALAKTLSLPPRNHYVPTDFSLHSSAKPLEQSLQAANAAAVALMQKLPSQDGQMLGLLAGEQLQYATDANGHARQGRPARRHIVMLSVPPSLIVDAPGLRVWHKLDQTFRLPKAVAYLCITSKAAYESPRAAAMTHLTLRLAEDALCETAYLADVAGLSYDMWPEGLAGVELKVEGFSHRLPLLVASVTRQLVGLQVDPSRFGRVREALALRYANSNMNPGKHASYLRLRALKRVWHIDDLLAELNALSPADVQDFVPRLFRGTHIETLLQGNLRSADALEIAEDVRAMFSDGILFASERPLDAVTCLPPGCNLLHRAPVKNPEEDNSVAEVYLQAGPNSPAARAQLDLLEQCCAEPFYDTLRTKEQLGYSVHCSTRLTHGVLGFAFVVNSGTHGPAHLDARIDAFLEGFAKTLGAMSGDELEGHREALIASKTLKDASLHDEADRNWEQISSKTYEFLAREQEVAALQELTLDKLHGAFAELFLPGSPQRRKLAVRVIGKSHAAELTAAVPEGVERVEDLPGLQQRLGAWPTVVGVTPTIAGVLG